MACKVPGVSLSQLLSFDFALRVQALNAHGRRERGTGELVAQDMAWETRGGRRYYCRKLRVDGQVRSIYVGHGQTGTEAELADQVSRAQIDAARALEQSLIAAAQRNEEAISDVDREVRDTVAAVLLLTGHYRHKRQWRLRRGG
jgi:hypothetical protein